MFWGMVMYNNEFKTKGSKDLIKGKKKLNHNIYIACIVGMEATCPISLFH